MPFEKEELKRKLREMRKQLITEEGAEQETPTNQDRYRDESVEAP